MLVVVGVTAISSFTLVNQSLAGNIFFLRIFILVISYFLGMFGFVLTFISTIIYMSKLTSFKVPLLAVGLDPNWKKSLQVFGKLPYNLSRFFSGRNALKARHQTRSLGMDEDTRKEKVLQPLNPLLHATGKGAKWWVVHFMNE
ncbi:spore germination protein [Priestia koreensis]|uniref:spore germination protein n=2 Tax=Priestia koreensis TaxID=284581 RepID=UPI00203EF7DD|nr:spore germination protein [Priestia koreensis]MCM3003321.1 spore germination protein [Priestia koreensis]